MNKLFKLCFVIILILTITTLTSCKKYECETETWNTAISELSNCEISLTIKKDDEEVKTRLAL